MIDLHSHLIFNVDDGPSDLTESMKMLENAYGVGFTNIIATPHFIKNSKYISEANDNREIIDIINKEMDFNGININLFLGSEVYMVEDLISDIEANKATTLNDSSYLLLEVSPHGIVLDNLLSFIFDLQVNGYKVILAHPERYDFVRRDCYNIERLIHRDVLMQMNILSVMGYYGKEAKEIAFQMLQNNMVHFLGSDAHKAEDYLLTREAINLIKDRIGNDTFTDLSETNPRFVLNNQVFYPKTPVIVKKRKIFSLFQKG